MYFCNVILLRNIKGKFKNNNFVDQIFPTFSLKVQSSPGLLVFSHQEMSCCLTKPYFDIDGPFCLKYGSFPWEIGGSIKLFDIHTNCISWASKLRLKTFKGQKKRPCRKFMIFGSDFQYFDFGYLLDNFLSGRQFGG